MENQTTVRHENELGADFDIKVNREDYSALITYGNFSYTIRFNERGEYSWDALNKLQEYVTTVVGKDNVLKEMHTLETLIKRGIDNAIAKQITFSDIKGEDLETPIKIHTFISGETNAKAIHYMYQVFCPKCHVETSINFGNDIRDIYKLITSGDKWRSIVQKKYLDLYPECEDHIDSVVIKQEYPPLIYYGAYMRDAIDLATANTSTNKNYFGYIMNEIPPNKDVMIRGCTMMNNKTHDVEYLAKEVIPSQSTIDSFKLSSKDALRLKEYFSKLHDLEDFKELATYNNPRIAGRTLAKLASMLTFASVLWINVNNDIRPAVIRTMFYGDARTGKGKIGGYLSNKINLGHHAIGETSSRTGISYSIDTTRNILTWGALVEADRGLLHIEGMHLFPSYDLASLREAFAKLYIEVRRLYSAKANARTRIIADANAKKELSYYPFKCGAIRELACFLDQVEITRWDLFIPFSSGDVAHDDIAKAITTGNDNTEFLDNFKTLVLWAWSRNVDDIILSDGTIEATSEVFKSLITKYANAELPIVNEDTFFSILKLSCAFAVLSFSTDSTCQKLIVKPEHVALTKELLEEVYSEQELPEYLAFKGRNDIVEADLIEFASIIANSDIAEQIVSLLIDSTASAKELANMMNANESYVREICAKLKANGFVAKTTKGYALTPRGIQVWKTMKNKTVPKVQTLNMVDSTEDKKK